MLPDPSLDLKLRALLEACRDALSGRLKTLGQERAAFIAPINARMRLMDMVGGLLLRARRAGLPFSDSSISQAIERHFETRKDAIRADEALLLEGIRSTFSLEHITTGDYPRLRAAALRHA